MAIPKIQIRDFLLQNLEGAKLASGNTEVVAPCPVCGEKRLKFYIGPFNDSDQPIQYNCYICKAHGYVDQYFLDMCNISSNIDPALLKANKGPGYSSKGLSSNRIYNLTYDYITPCQMSEFKLDYINKRLGLKLTYQDCIDNKIVLNIYDLLDRNGITNYSRPKQAMDALNSYFLGFMTRSNSEINMRNLVFENKSKNKTFHESMQSKYVNYKIFPNIPDNDFYVLPCTIDTRRLVKVYIAEGPMDVLGIKYNLIKSVDNCVYIAGKGKAYQNAILWSIKSLACSNVEIHLFPDKDVSNVGIRNDILMFNSVFTSYRFFIHNNQFKNEKDYGVPEWRISDYMWEERDNRNIL